MYYEEKVFDGETWFRTSPASAWQKKLIGIVQMLDIVKQKLSVKTLCIALDTIGMDHSTYTRVRQGKLSVSAKAVLNMHFVTGMDVDEICNLVGYEKTVQ